MKNFTIGSLFSNPIYDPFTQQSMKGLLDVHIDSISSPILVISYCNLLQEFNQIS